MLDLVTPTDINDVEESVRDALTNRRRLSIIGAGSKRSLGQEMDIDQVVSLSRLTGVTLYEPEELVMTVRAGTPLSEIKVILAEQQQQLAFEPPDWAPLLGSNTKQTIGGVVATNISGPRRFQLGAVRDHVLGLTMVTGRGETVKAGGRVVKNVTGYDLCKLITGSYGTLAITTDITIKTLPEGKKIRTVLVAGLDPATAVTVMTEALNGPFDVSAAGYLPENITGRSGVSFVSGAFSPITAIRLEGTSPSVEARCIALRDMFRIHGPVEELHFHNSQRFWCEIADVTPFVGKKGLVWRISAPPSEAGRIVREVADASDAEFYFDWAGGQIWLKLSGNYEDGGASIVRDTIKSCGGHATLIRADKNIRDRISVFHPKGKGEQTLAHRIKQGFDPGGILNPGRMALLGARRSNAD